MLRSSLYAPHCCACAVPKTYAAGRGCRKTAPSAVSGGGGAGAGADENVPLEWNVAVVQHGATGVSLFWSEEAARACRHGRAPEKNAAVLFRGILIMLNFFIRGLDSSCRTLYAIGLSAFENATDMTCWRLPAAGPLLPEGMVCRNGLSFEMEYITAGYCLASPYGESGKRY